MKSRILAGLVTTVALWPMAAGAASGNSITPVCTVGTAAAQPCSVSWYGSPVFVSWTWSPWNTGSGDCPTGPYDSDTNTTISCTVTWTDGTSLTYTEPLHVETSSPTATAAPSRPPDSNGWYNRAVTATLSATSFSGIASCTSTTYAGPNTTGGTVGGACIDNAGKTVTVTSQPFAYDATAPALVATATAGDQSVSLNWQTGGDIAPIASIVLTRSRTGDPAATATVYSGDASGFNDTHLRNGVLYTYTITARDAAGNVSAQAVQATPGPRLLSPAANARVTVPPMLRWTAVPGASYYNVQLYRAGPTKVLSLWPAHASLQLRRTWRFGGRRDHLKPGRYRWYVWPGFGKRKSVRYGHMIGSGTFVVIR